jgi:hypothetical protein
VLVQLGRTTQTIYFSISIFTMLCPYYAAYSTVLKFRINSTVEQIERQSKLTCCQTLTSIIVVLPTMLLILITFDFLYMSLSITCLPILIILKVICKLDWLQQFEELVNKGARKLFNMTYMDVQGFRLQRTILQVQLESVPQIILQIVMYVKFGADDNLDISLDAIFYSIMFAIIHILVEMVSMYIEAATSGSTIIGYTIACFNGR